MVQISGRELDRGRLYERESGFADRVKRMLEEHIEQRIHFRVYTPEQAPRETWTWGLGPDVYGPYKGEAWIDTVYVHPGGKVYLHFGSCDVDSLISEEHPRVYGRLVKEEGDQEKKVEEFHRILDELQFRENWKKYRSRIPKVIEFFKECEGIAGDVSDKHGVQVEFWIDNRRCGVRAVVDTKDMEEYQKLKAIMNASVALKDFYCRLHSGA